jgi:hypothetical protein
MCLCYQGEATLPGSQLSTSVYRQTGEERRTPQRSSAGVRCGAHGGTSLGNATVIQSWTVSASCSDESSAVQLTSHTTDMNVVSLCICRSISIPPSPQPIACTSLFPHIIFHVTSPHFIPTNSTSVFSLPVLLGCASCCDSRNGIQGKFEVVLAVRAMGHDSMRIQPRKKDVTPGEEGAS